jgi:hypothetical protein
MTKGLLAQLRRAREQARGRKTLFVCTGGLPNAKPIDLTAAFQELNASNARYGVVGLGHFELQVEEDELLVARKDDVPKTG